jgi:hypothetical protein
MEQSESSVIATMTAEDKERAALTPSDYAAAGVEPPNWRDDPIPSLETWRAWQKAQDAALAHKRAATRAAQPR